MRPMGLLFVLLSLACFSNSSNAQEKSVDQGTTWLVIRHGEKDNDELLNEQGKLRAKKLKKLAGLFRIKAIYSTETPRTQETVKPSADKLGLQIQPYGATDAKWFEAMKQKHDGETVLIVGHSNTVEDIVKGFGGVGDFSVEPAEFDSLFVVTTDQNGTRAIRLKYGN